MLWQDGEHWKGNETGSLEAPRCHSMVSDKRWRGRVRFDFAFQRLGDRTSLRGRVGLLGVMTSRIIHLLGWVRGRCLAWRLVILTTAIVHKSSCPPFFPCTHRDQLHWKIFLPLPCSPLASYWSPGIICNCSISLVFFSIFG